MASLCQQLQVGQKVSVRDLEHGCELALVPADQPAATVVELAADYLVLEDSSGDVRTRIPLYLVKAVGPAQTPAIVTTESVPVESIPTAPPAPAVTTAA